MSHAPVTPSEYEGRELVYADATTELNRQIDEGTSWSGNERNNLFLNLGHQVGSNKSPDFAEFGALAGVDFPDDSRAITSLDWDFDGDLDILMTNRNAPRVRILENRMVTRPDSSLLLKLIGESANRDGIGSGITLTFKNGDGTESQSHRTQFGGHGFLSQSSSWLHFGLPEGSTITKVEVHWRPGGIEEFRGFAGGGSWTLTQGSGTAQQWKSPARVDAPSKSTPPPFPPTSDTTIAHLERPVPLPPISYDDSTGKSAPLLPLPPRPLLINLWASWCPACKLEITEFAAQQKLFADAGADVLALCVDVRANDQAGVATANKILQEASFPFPNGFATDKTLDLLHAAHNAVFYRPSQLPVPSTLLIDTQGRIASVVRGPVSPTDLIPAIEALRQGETSWKSFSNQFPGSWLQGPDTISYITIAKNMHDRGWIDETADFLLTHRRSLGLEGGKYADWLMLIGSSFVEKGALERGIALLQAAVEVNPKGSVARNNLAAALLQSGRADEAMPHLQAAITHSPDYLEPRVNLARLFHAQQRFPEALLLCDQVLGKGYHPSAIRIKAQVFVATRDFANLELVFQEITNSEPTDPVAWINLGKLQAQFNKPSLALASFEQAQHLVPDNTEVRSMVQKLRRQSGNFHR